MADSERPLGAKREATTAAMLDAAETLFSQRGFAAVSVRDIAGQAGVSHALVHRYLGSKEEIYHAVLVRNDSDIRDAAQGTSDLARALSLMLWDSQVQRPEYLRLVISSALQGMPYATTKGSFPATQRLIEIAEGSVAGRPRDPNQPPPRFVIAAIVALDVGWAAMEEWLVEVAALQDFDRKTLITWLEQVVLCIANGMLPGDD